MQKILSLLTVVGLLAVLAGCTGVIDEPTAAPEEIPAGASARDVSETAEGTETPPSGQATTAPEEGTGNAPETYYKPTEAVSYSSEGIPIANAYFSLRLPADWDGHYLCETNYTEDVMFLRFRHRASSDAGAGGTLFQLALVPAEAEFDVPEGKNLHTLSDGSETYALYAVYPTDVQYAPDTEEEYLAMQRQIDGALATLEPAAGFRF